MYIWTTEERLLQEGADSLMLSSIPNNKGYRIYVLRFEWKDPASLAAHIDDDLMLNDEEIPVEWQRLATKFTYRDRFISGIRRAGIYRHGSASAIINHVPGDDGQAIHEISLTCETLADGQQLYSLIRRGQILPCPEHGWSGDQPVIS